MSDTEKYDACMGALRAAENLHRLDGSAFSATAHMIVSQTYPEAADIFFAEGVRRCLSTWTPPEYRVATVREDSLARAAERREEARERKANREEYARRNRITLDLVPTHMLEAALAPIAAAQVKAEKYDKVIELFDTWMVGGVKLGDCTRSKLIAESAKHSRHADEATAHANLYQRLAAQMSDGETVRQCGSRSLLLDVLRSVSRRDAA